MHSTNKRPPFVSLEKSGVPIDLRAMRAAIADGRDMAQFETQRADHAERDARYFRDNYRRLARRAGEQAEELALALRTKAEFAEALSAQGDELARVRRTLRGAFVAEYERGNLTARGLRDALAEYGCEPFQVVEQVEVSFTVRVSVDLADFDHSDQAAEHVEMSLRDALEDGCMSLDSATSWTVKA